MNFSLPNCPSFATAIESIFSIILLSASVGSNLVSKNASIIFSISPTPVILPPNPNILAFKCFLAYTAEDISLTNVGLVPTTLAVDAVIPTPVPQRTTPKSACPPTTFSAAFYHI